ncbi:MAG: NAD(P)H-quinone oxidoreductase [Alphaproteobacteria bacterium]|nr:NAD(P)H-quinone oxidoreductase [Alphaproteobacteria bacterium]
MPAAVPPTMNAIAIAEPGGPEALVCVERPVPEPGANEVLIKVAAAGVNRPDIMQREGNYPPPPGASDLPGLEVAGEVVALGPGVTAPGLGEPVAALISGGGYAEYCVAPAPLALPVPAGLTLTEAAAIPETFATVWTNVFERARLQPGETFLVHGGTSGIGTTAIQLAKAFGATVLTTAGSPEKCAFCEELGADLAIPYKDVDFVAAVKDFTEKRGLDVILDMVGGDYVQRNLDCLGTEGRLVQIAFLKGPKVELNLIRLMLKRLTLAGSVLRARSVPEKAQVMEGLRQHVWPLFEAKRVKPVLDSTYALQDAAEAHRRMETSRHIGKIVLLP